MSDACAISASGSEFKITRVGILPGRERADLRARLAAKCLRRGRGRAFQDLHRRQAGLLHQLKLPKKRRAMNRADVAGVGPGRDRDAGILERLQILAAPRRRSCGCDRAPPPGARGRS